MKTFSEVHARLLELHKEYEAALEREVFDGDERAYNSDSILKRINRGNELLKIVSKRPPESTKTE